MSKKSRKTKYPNMFAGLEIQFKKDADRAQDGIDRINEKMRAIPNSFRDVLNLPRSEPLPGDRNQQEGE